MVAGYTMKICLPPRKRILWCWGHRIADRTSSSLVLQAGSPPWVLRCRTQSNRFRSAAPSRLSISCIHGTHTHIYSPPTRGLVVAKQAIPVEVQITSILFQVQKDLILTNQWGAIRNWSGGGLWVHMARKIKLWSRGPFLRKIIYQRCSGLTIPF